MQTLPIGKIKANPNNPRTIKDDKFFKLGLELSRTGSSSNCRARKK